MKNRLRTHILVSISILIFAVFATADQIKLVPKKSVEVKGSIVRFGDIFEKIKSEIPAEQIEKLNQIRIRSAPLPGRPPIELDATKIRTAFRIARTKLNEIKLSPDSFKLPDEIKITVHRKMTQIEKTDLIEFASEILLETLIDRFEGDYQLTANDSRIRDLKLPFGENVEFKNRRIRGHFLAGRTTVYVDIYIDEKKRKSVMVPFEVTLTTDLLIAKKDLDRDQKITLDDVEIVMQTLDSARVPPVTAEGLTHHRATRRITEGNLLTVNMVERIPKILRGNLVSIVVNLNGVSISVMGEALSDGYIGDEVEVKNQQSKKILSGVVTKDGSIRIGTPQKL